MKFKLDENIPIGALALFSRLNLDADTVQSEGLRGRPDRDVLSAAIEAGRILMTQDLDYTDIRKYSPGEHSGVVVLRLYEPGGQAIVTRLASVLASEDYRQWAGALVIISATKVRIVRKNVGS